LAVGFKHRLMLKNNKVGNSNEKKSPQTTTGRLAAGPTAQHGC
jgi:hypothetical protein